MRHDGSIEVDATKRPEVFRWTGTLSEASLRTWAREHGRVPEDLLSFWASTGGGLLFETESLLSPFGNVTVGDDVDGVTARCVREGLSADWVVFHVGLGLSAFHRVDGHYAWFERRTGEPSRVFETLDAWYRGTLRAEYAERYGL